MFARPHTMLVQKAELTKRRLKAACIRALKETHRGYIIDNAAWIDYFAPQDTGDLRTDLKASTQEGFISEKGGMVSLVLHLRSMVPYAPYVNSWPPWVGKNGATKATVNWTNVFTQEHYFDVLAAENDNSIIPFRLNIAMKNEGLI